MAVDTNGKVYGWGNGSYGSLGIGELGSEDEQIYPTPQQIPFPEGVKIKKVAVGNDFSMALANDNTLYTFGKKGTGHKQEIVWTPRVLDLSEALNQGKISDIVQMVGGSDHGCLLVEVDEAEDKAGPENAAAVNSAN